MNERDRVFADLERLATAANSVQDYTVENLLEYAVELMAADKKKIEQLTDDLAAARTVAQFIVELDATITGDWAESWEELVTKAKGVLK